MSYVHHTTTTQQRAFALHEAGWSTREIAAILKNEGTPVAPSTVGRWVNPELWTRENQRRRLATTRGSFGGATRTASSEWKLRRAQRLREAGLTIRGVCIVLRVDFGEEIEPEKMRYALQVGRWPA